VIPAQHDRDGARIGDFADLAPDDLVAAADVGRRDRRVPGVHAVEPFERLDAQLQRVQAPGVVRRGADGARTESGAGAVAHRVVEWSTDDGDIRAALRQGGIIGHQRQLLEGRAPEVGGQLEVGVGGVRVRIGGRRPLVVARAAAPRLIGHAGRTLLLAGHRRRRGAEQACLVCVGRRC